MAELTVRRYREADHDAVWELHDLALREAGVHAGHGAWDDDLNSIEQTYLVPRRHHYVETGRGRLGEFELILFEKALEEAPAFTPP